MSKLIILVGISGSGKSTWVLEYLRNNPNTIRINRDSIRLSLTGELRNYYKRKNLDTLELMVNGIEDYLLKAAYTKGLDVIVDNTNLRQEYIKKWSNWSESGGIKSYFVLFDCELEFAKNRVSRRDFIAYSDLSYIDKQFKQYGAIKEYLNKNFKPQII